MTLLTISYFFANGKMKNIWLGLFLYGFPLLAQINQNGDFQFWNQMTWDHKINTPFATRLVGELRWGDHAKRLYYTYVQGQLVYVPKKWIELAPGYRQEYERMDTHWATSYSPMFDVTFILTWKGRCAAARDFFTSEWQLDDRNRIFYRIPEHASAFWIYRNRLRITTPEITQFLKLRLYMDDEIFISERRGFDQNRLSIGFLATFSHAFNLRLSYLFRSLKLENWLHHNVLNLQFFLKF